MKILSASRCQTFDTAKNFAAGLSGGEVILITGRLGAGKTVFCKGLAKGLNIKHEITSPTFNIMNVYGGGRLRLCHCDAYRLNGGGDEFGISDYLGEKNTVTVIEWPENLGALPSGKIIKVSIDFLSANKREISIETETK